MKKNSTYQISNLEIEPILRQIMGLFFVTCARIYYRLIYVRDGFEKKENDHKNK